MAQQNFTSSNGFGFQDFTIARGTLYIQAPGETGWRPFGECPEVNITAQIQTTDLYSSTTSIKVLIERKITQVDYTLAMTCNNISMENINLFLNGTYDTQTIAQQSNVAETFTVGYLPSVFSLGSIAGIDYVSQFSVSSIVSSGGTYKVTGITVDAGGTDYAVGDSMSVPGVGQITVTTVGSSGAITAISTSSLNSESATNPAGTGIAVTGGSGSGLTVNVTSSQNTSSPLVQGVDYNVNGNDGLVYILSTAKNIAVGETFTVTWSAPQTTQEVAISGVNQQTYSLMYQQDNTAGVNKTYIIKSAMVAPDGNLTLNGSDYGTIGLTCAVTTNSPNGAITVNGAPLLAVS